MQVSTIFKTIAISAVMAFAVGCGKDNKSGGNSNTSFNLYSNNLDQQSQNSLNTLKTWYESLETILQPPLNNGWGQQPPTIAYYQRREFVSSNTNSNCHTQNVSGGWLGGILGAVGMNQISICSGSTNQNTGELVGKEEVVILRDKAHLAVSQKGNILLNDIMGNRVGTLLKSEEVGNGVTRLIFLSGNNFVTYIIDRKLPSEINPMVKIEQIQQPYSVKELRTFYRLQ